MRTTPDNPNPLYEPEKSEWFAVEDLPRRRQAKGRSWLLNTLILAGVSLLSISLLAPNRGHGRRHQGQLTACKSNLKNIGTAMEMYATDSRGAYPTSLSTLTPNYLKAMPECPAAKARTYRAYFGPSAPMNVERIQDYFYLDCAGENHQRVGVRGDYPAYNGVEGLINNAPAPQTAVASPSANPSRIPLRQ